MDLERIRGDPPPSSPLWEELGLGGVEEEDFLEDEEEEELEREALNERSLMVFLGEAGGTEGVFFIGAWRLETDTERSRVTDVVVEARGLERICLCSGTFSLVVEDEFAPALVVAGIESFALRVGETESLVLRVGDRQRGELKLESLNLEFFLVGDILPEEEISFFLATSNWSVNRYCNRFLLNSSADGVMAFLVALPLLGALPIDKLTGRFLLEMDEES